MDQAAGNARAGARFDGGVLVYLYEPVFWRVAVVDTDG